jgi:tetratricopeptide (TPR) repeat protein
MNIGSISSVVKLTLLTTLVAVTGCTTVVPEPQVAVETPETGIIEQKPAAPRRPHPNEYPVKNFEEDELYELLVAEVAGFRQDYEIALDTYVNIATLTRDPGVATRAAMLAAYLQRDEVALSLAKIWAEEDPDNIDAHRFIADLLMRVGDLEGAIAHMEEIKRLGGLANFEIFAYQVANLGDGDRTTLLAAISRMLEADDQDEQLLFSKAVLLEQNGDYEEALAIADRLLAKKKNVNVIILKVNALKDQDRNPDVVTFLEEMLIELPENRRLRLFYARFLFETDDLDGSRAQYELVLKDAPSDGDVLFALALIAFEQKDDVEAERHLLEMVRWSRRVGEAHFYLGSIAERRNDLAQAIREYKQVGTGYEFLPAQSRIASIMIEQGRVQEARDYLARLRAEEPERRDQLIMVEAQLLSERSLRDEVFDLLDTSLAEDPKNIDLLYFRAMTGEKFGDLSILERDLRAIITIQPGNADALNALGYTLTDRTDRHEEALALIERALAINPSEAAFIDSLGWALYRLENFTESVAHLRKALELFPNDEVAAHLGEVLWVMGERLEANEVWRKALELAPQSEILKKIIQQFTTQ